MSEKVENLVREFLSAHEVGLRTIFKLNFRSSTEESFQSFLDQLREPLIHEVKNWEGSHSSWSGLPSQLFYLVNQFAKSHADPPVPTKELMGICPGCLFLGQENYMKASYGVFSCSACQQALLLSSDPKEIFLRKTFATHSQKGFACPECQGFLPKPLNGFLISCPYYQCLFNGSILELSKMPHPSKKMVRETTTVPLLSDLEKIIHDEIAELPYRSSGFTVKQKQLICQSFLLLLKREPNFKFYLQGKSRGDGFQHKMFQTFISLLEKEIPFSFKKQNKIITIDNLLSSDLNLFDGISVFRGKIENSEIKNKTQEFYVGGRKGSYAEPYYIGKLLSVHSVAGKCLMKNVEEYSFSKIKMRDIVSGKIVKVTHLRIPPHYQMGGMSHINRIRKYICQKYQQLKANHEASQILD